VRGEATYTSTYLKTKRQYTVTFFYDDGTPFASETYEYGSEITPPDTARESDETFAYTFSKWQTEFETVTEDTIYVAIYDKTYIEYTVVFVDYDGSELLQGTYHYGDSVTLPEDPTREGTEDVAYIFSGWSPEVKNVIGDTTYTATYTEKSLLYTVTFTNYDGSTLTSAQYHAGETVILPQETPQRTVVSKSYYYVFSGWGNVLPVSGDTIYTAQYERKNYEYTVTFVDYDGRQISEAVYHYNDTVVSPEDPTRNGYVFDGWSPSVAKVSGDATYTATYVSAGTNEAFRTAVAKVQSLSSSSLSARLSAITEALTAYGNVADKEAVSEEYAVLQEEIKQYNADVQSLNEVAERAESNSFALFAEVAAAVGALTAAAFVLRSILKGGRR
jgi:hypothetical protein